jgi:sigma-54 dependent transcriptional regulator, acetoin dehydrogenase operon transcriptional activator AcoR
MPGNDVQVAPLAGSEAALYLRGEQSDSDTSRAWECFVAGEALLKAPVHGDVLSSWRRSRQFGVKPTETKAPLVASGESVERLRRQRHDLLLAASPLFAATGELLARSGSIMLLTNAEGVVLEAQGSPHTLEAGRQMHLMEGGQWSEGAVGTNGIGTAIATGMPAHIFASEHYCQGMKGWTCAAVPIREPGTNAILGVIDISGPPNTYQVNNLTLAIAAARQIEVALAQRVSIEHLQLLEICLQRLSLSDAAGMIAIDRSGLVVHSTRRMQLPVALGQRIAGLDANTAVEDWAQRLPDGLRPEWFNPVRAEGRTIGAVMVVPKLAMRSSVNFNTSLLHQGLHGTAPRAGEASSELDPRRCGFANIFGQSAAMITALQRAQQLSLRRVPVLIYGETGVGKELFARAVHGDDRVGGPFIAFNCGAATKELIAGELFGHVRGAFTGATAEGRPGRFELAHGGTLCLDEIGDLPLDLQPVLLRALEEGVIYRLGDSKPRRVDVRLVAMTNRNLIDEVEAGHFRRDLYHRISVTRLLIPPLRDRGGDLDILTEHFNQSLAMRHGVLPRLFVPEVMALMHNYSWPGNVRELRNVVESLLLTSEEPCVQCTELPPELLEEAREAPCTDHSAAMGSAGKASSLTGRDSLEDTEREAITRAVRTHDGNLTKAALALGISRSTLYRKVERYHVADGLDIDAWIARLRVSHDSVSKARH